MEKAIPIEVIQCLLRDAMQNEWHQKPPCALNLLPLLRKLRACGCSKEDAVAALTVLRQEYSNQDEFEDFILEVLDFSTGFCNQAYRVWED